jgi:hypothetical protein
VLARARPSGAGEHAAVDVGELTAIDARSAEQGAHATAAAETIHV